MRLRGILTKSFLSTEELKNNKCTVIGIENCKEYNDEGECMQCNENYAFNETDRNKCINIENFPKKFPNLARHQYLQNAEDIFEMLKELQLPKKLNDYFDIITQIALRGKQNRTITCKNV